MRETAARSSQIVIGVLTPHTGGFYYGTVINGILRTVRQHGAVAIAFEASRLRLFDGMSVLSSARVDGWIAVNEFNDPELLAELRARGAPLIHLHSKPDTETGAVVLPDNEGGTRAVTQHLIEHGHRRIAFAGNLVHVDIAERFSGYRIALEQAGIPVLDDLVFDTPHHKEADGKRVAHELLEMRSSRRAGVPKAPLAATALVAATDRLALGAMGALALAGLRVPDDLAIVGFDDADAAQFAEPPLTTVRQNFAEVASHAVAELLAAMREGRAPRQLVRVPTQPILRRSCGCLVSHSIPPSAPNSMDDRVQALTRELLSLAGRSRMACLSLAEWPGAEKIARALAHGSSAKDGVDAIRGEDWAGFLAHNSDAENVVRVMELLESALRSWASSGEGERRGILRDLRVALVQKWQRSERVRVEHYESVTEAAYRLANSISNSTLDPSLDLSWIRWSNAQHACCALWQRRRPARAAADAHGEEPPSRSPSEIPSARGLPLLRVTGEYTSRMGAVSKGPSQELVSPAEFPPLEMLETAAREGAIVSVASVPSGRGAPHGLLAVVAPLPFEQLEYVGTPSDWAVQLGAALDRAHAERELRRSAELDALTNLPNRTTLLRRLDALRTADDVPNFALLSIDLDDFKKINDSLGHEAGDRLLVQVARRLMSEVGASTWEDRSARDLVARVGGDEFVVVLANVGSETDAISMAERLQHRLGEPYALHGRTVFVSASIGVNLARGTGSRALELLRDADTATYRAKRKGRARYEVFHRGMHTQALEKLHLDARLRLAIEQEELELWYQPIVDLETGIDVGAEALVRWRDPEQGLLPPGRFLPIAEDVGLAIPISEWVIRSACAEAAAWHPPAGQRHYVNVNVPAAHIKKPGFVQFIARALEENQLAPSAFGIEIVESALLDEPGKSAEVLSELLALGVRIAIDDFGTGYSSLSYLRDFPVTTLKIDRSFVKNVTEDARDRGIAQAIIAMGQGLGLGIVAEGIETLEQLQFLKQAGCDYAQGYYLSVPLDPRAYAERLDRFSQTPVKSDLVSSEREPSIGTALSDVSEASVGTTQSRKAGQRTG